ncbi:MULTISPECIES: hypothetical protein [Streptomyces]|nr:MULTISPECIES: hypothetical protein [Streptomyces]MCH0560725.1 hypothetical protein [Streptomyces sp. MUM 16J]
MDTYDEDLTHKIDAWVQDQLKASPEWPPEQYISIRQHLEGTTPPREAGA